MRSDIVTGSTFAVHEQQLEDGGVGAHVRERMCVRGLLDVGMSISSSGRGIGKRRRMGRDLQRKSFVIDLPRWRALVDTKVYLAIPGDEDMFRPSRACARARRFS